MRLHIDGDLVAETHLHSLYSEPDYQDDANQINLLGSEDKLEGYVYNMELSCMLGNIQQQFAKVMQLRISRFSQWMCILCNIFSLNCRTHHLNYLLTTHALMESKRVMMVFGILWVGR